MDKQGQQEHQGLAPKVPRWTSLSQAFLSLKSKKEALVLIIRAGKLHTERRMPSPWLAHQISEQEVIYKLPSVHRDGTKEMICEHQHLTFGVFLLFSNEGEC